MERSLAKLSARLPRWVDAQLPAAVLTADAATLRRARLCVALPLFGGVAAVVGCGIQLATGRPLVGVFASACGALVGFLSTQLVRVTRSGAIAAQVILASAILFMSFGAWIAGGLGTPRFFLLCLVPLVATLLSGWRSALAWTSAVVLEVLVLIGLHLSGAGPSPNRPLEELRVSHGLALIVGLAVVMGVSIFYERSHARVSEKLEHARDQARGLSDLKSRLVANVSHELRTPLAGLIGSIELAQQRTRDEETGELLDTIADSSDVLLQLANDLLDLSRIEAGGLRIEPCPLSLRETLSRTVAVLGPQAKPGVRVVLHVNADVADGRLADPHRLRQVLTNLLANALKFTDAGHVRLEVEAREAQVVRFRVIDSGLGIAAEDLERLFEAFQQADIAASRRSGGAGLGLNIASQLVRQLGYGAIEVRSVVGEGSEFWFDAPMPLAEHAAADVEVVERGVSVELSDDLEAAAARACLEWAGIEERSDGVRLLDSDDDRVGAAVLLGEGAALPPSVRGRIRLPRPLGPIRLLAALRRAQRGESSERPKEVGQRRRRGTVLIADDDPIGRHVLARQLGHLGFEALVVEDGTKAMGVLESSPDLAGAFLDWSMPGATGLEVARSAREAGVTAPLYMLTGHGGDSERAAAAEVGVVDFLVKPVRLHQLERLFDRSEPPPPITTSVPSPAALVDEATWADLLSLAGSDAGFLEELVGGFVATTQARIDELRTAPVDEVQALSHAMKGAARQMGAVALSDHAAALEEDPTSRDESLARLEACFELSQTELRRRVAAHESS